MREIEVIVILALKYNPNLILIRNYVFSHRTIFGVSNGKLRLLKFILSVDEIALTLRIINLIFEQT